MLNLICALTCLVAMQTPTEADDARFDARLRQCRRLTAPPRLDMLGLNHGEAGELRFRFAYAEKDEPPGEFDMRVVVTDPVSGAILARQSRRLVARWVVDSPMAVYSEPASPGPEDGQWGYFRLEFRRKLPPGRYRVTVSAGGIISMTRDYVVRG